MSRATLKDVADKANVSRTTASLILNGKTIRVTEETRQKVLRVAQELQYTPNALIRSLQTQQTYTIGVYLGAGEDILNAYIGTLFNSIRSAAERMGYDVLVYRIGKAKEPINVSQFLDGRVDGLIFWSGLREISYADLARAKLPVVVLLDQPDSIELPSVTFDDESGMRQAVEHLIQLGHRQIAYMPGRDVPHLNRRLQIFERTIAKYSELNLEVQIYNQPFLKKTSLTECLADAKRRPTAIVCAFDALAITCMNAASTANLSVPDDLSILSWESLTFGSSPQFTHVKHKVNVLGKEAVRSLTYLIQGKDLDPVHREIPVSFHELGTTGKAP